MESVQPRLLSTYLTNNQEHATMRDVGVRDDHHQRSGARRIRDSTMQADPQSNTTPTTTFQYLALALIAQAEEEVARRAPTRKQSSRKNPRNERQET
jgi:hypothetical protein